MNFTKPLSAQAQQARKIYTSITLKVIRITFIFIRPYETVTLA